MDKSKQLPDNEKWKAIVECEKSYDGLFFYGVKTTGVFCRPSCRAKTPGRENVVFFEDSTAALKAGFRPCKKCRPDQAAFEPELELVNRVKGILDNGCAELLELEYAARQLGISLGYLSKLFKKYSGFTLKQYVTSQRVVKAMELLSDTDEGILDIAYMAGFKSLSGFYKYFKEYTGHTPREYRKDRGEV